MKLHELKQKRSTIAGQMRKLNDDYSEKRWDEPATKQWGDMVKELWPFMYVQLAVLMLLSYVPWITTVGPALFGFN